MKNKAKIASRVSRVQLGVVNFGLGYSERMEKDGVNRWHW